MATYAVTDEQLTAIADAIRLKRDIVSEIEVDDMPLQIGLIEGGDEIKTMLNSLIDGSVMTVFADVPTIRNYAFFNCSNLTTADFPNATNIGSYAFRGCSNLTTADFPNVTNVDMYAFQGCSSLTSINFPNATNIGSYAFFNCSNLTTADLPNATSIGGAYTFRGCSSLTSIILRKNEVCTLSNANVINNGTPFASNGTGGTLYVPRDLIASYKVAQNWSTILGYSNNQIKAIEDMV